MKLTTLMLLSTIAFSTIVKAGDIAIPAISKPAVLMEGTQRELTVTQIAELLPWAKNSKVFLQDLVSSIQGLSSADQADRLADGIAYVVGESAPKNAELLMRYSLNRGLALNKILTDEMASDEVGTIDARLRVLRSSINMALKYYDNDMETINKKINSPFVAYGTDYFAFLNDLNKSIFDASAQYNIQKAALEWLQWDLYRDLNNASYAPQIVKINNAVKILPKTKLSDKQSLTFIRQMKLVANSLNIQATTQQVSNKLSYVEDLSNDIDQITASVVNNTGAFQAGETVITNDRYTGVITKIFSDGLIKVQIGDNTYSYYKNQLSRPIKCFQSFCEQQTVVTNDRYTGTIKQVFADGLIKVSIGDNDYNYYTTQISYPISCIKGFCTGNTVDTTDHYTGTIKQVFADGLIKVSIGDNDYNYYTNQLTKI